MTKIKKQPPCVRRFGQGLVFQKLFSEKYWYENKAQNRKS